MTVHARPQPPRDCGGGVWLKGPVIGRRNWVAGLVAAALPLPASAASAEPAVKVVDIGGGVGLHYLEAGRGPALVFIHGSLGNLFYWSDQIGPFSERFRTIAYSRRYNYPNTNAAVSGYSAIVDAEDLAGLILKLGLAPCHVVGHSYGAFTALVLATRRPDLVRAVTLAEAPAMSLLQHVPPPDTDAGRAMFADVNARMVAPMVAAFSEGRREDGVRVFIDYVLGPRAWEAMSPLDKAETLREAEEWDVMLPHGELFPEVAPAAVSAVRLPTLLLSGARSYPFLRLIDEALLALLPQRRHIVFPKAGHQMWLQEPDACRRAVFDLAGR
ncbi:MAG TPA: alpha/beta hydrolase [Caulobacteraceae bacterium]|nr:alpha/beta hydrolase [Caulobacteraceae bacterium]